MENFQEIVTFTLLVVVGIQSVFIYKSVSQDFFMNAIGKGRKLADKTDTPLDDLLIDLAEMLAGLQRETESKPENVVKSE